MILAHFYCHEPGTLQQLGCKPLVCRAPGVADSHTLHGETGIWLSRLQHFEAVRWGVKVKVAQSYLTLCNPMDCSPPGSSVYGILQARILEWVATPFSRGSSQPRDRTQGSCIASRSFIIRRRDRDPCFSITNSDAQQGLLPKPQVPVSHAHHFPHGSCIIRYFSSH